MARGRHRAALVAIATTAAASLAACGAVKVEGTLDATAYSCSTAREATVALSILSDTALYETVDVEPGTEVSLHLSPGHYLVRVRGASSRVTMDAGSTVRVVLRPTCAP